MLLPAKFSARFSPYHDDDPITDFFEDSAQRITSVMALVVAVHVGLYFSLTANFVIPDLKPDEPESIAVQIVAFEDITTPESDTTPAPEEISPAIPIQAPPPRVKPVAPPPELRSEPEPIPVPEPTPEPEPIPEPIPQPVPEIEPEPIPEPEPVFTPPPAPEIIAQELPEPEPEAIAEPIITPEPIAEPIPEPIPEPPIVEIFEPEPIIVEPLPEPITPEPITPEPVILEPIEVEPLEPIIAEPITPEIIEPEIIEPEIIEPEIIEPEPLDTPLVTPDPVELPPSPGAIIDEPLPEIIEPDPLPAPIEPEPVPLPEPEPEPEPDITDIQPPEIEVIEPAPPIVTTAPTILASPDAPVSSEDIEKAVPQSQSDPFLDLLKRDNQSRPEGNGARNPAIAGPSRGGGNLGTPPPSGGTRIGGPPRGNWQISPNSYGQSPGRGYDGINLDIRCREADRTHKDCPEYVRKFEGRDAQGFENWQGRAGTGTNAGATLRPQGRVVPSRSALGVSNPLGSSINGFGTQESFSNLGSEFSLDAVQPANRLQGPSDEPARLRDLILGNQDTESAPPPNLGIDVQSLPAADDQEPDPNAWILKKPPQ